MKKELIILKIWRVEYFLIILEKLKIDGEDIPISEMGKIAKKVLLECNYVHPKNKNNQTVHKSGEGKLMITSGMTVNEFKNKFNLN
jgi:hypothetical protein